MRKRYLFNIIQILLPLLAYSSGALGQQELTVGPAGNYTTIKAAIDAAAAGAGDTVRVEPGTYAENLTISSDIVLRGDETARVILESAETGDTGTILTITNVSDVTIRNLTFSRGATGIAIDTSTNSGITIANNVFDLSNSSTGIAITDQDSGAVIRNNSFINNDIAISSSASASLITIENNIFAGNNETLNPGNGAESVSYNCYANGETVINNEDLLTYKRGDVLFANQSIQDFHLTANSVCKDIGGLDDGATDIINDSPADAGAYGGQLAEARPYPPQSLTATANNDPANYSIQLDWQRNDSYLIEYYKVYYGSQRSGLYTGADAEDDLGNEFLSGGNADNVTSFTLHNLTAPEITPDTPTVSELQPSYGQIRVNWTPVQDANGYIVYWGIAATDENQIILGDVASYTIPDLLNGTTYQVQVAAIKQARYYFVVSAVATSLIDSTAVVEEGAPSQEVVTEIGPQLESPPSAVQTAIPEEVEPYPALPDTGDERCFIATATYGNKNAVEVLILREFRDQLLMPSAIGQKLVNLYYHHSPSLAKWLESHAHIKPIIKIVLLPIIWLAIWLTYATPLHFSLLLFLMGIICLIRYQRIVCKIKAS